MASGYKLEKARNRIAPCSLAAGEERPMSKTHLSGWSTACVPSQPAGKLASFDAGASRSLPKTPVTYQRDDSDLCRTTDRLSVRADRRRAAVTDEHR
jgi:hypothetical protein